MAEPSFHPLITFLFPIVFCLFSWVLGMLSKHPTAELYVQALAGFDGKGVYLVNEDKDWLTVFRGVWYQEECSERHSLWLTEFAGVEDHRNPTW